MLPFPYSFQLGCIVFFSQDNLSSVCVMAYCLKFAVNNRFLIRCKRKAEAIGSCSNKGYTEFIAISHSMHKADNILCHFSSTLAAKLQGAYMSSSIISISSSRRKLVQRFHVPSKDTRLKGYIFRSDKPLFKCKAVIRDRQFCRLIFQRCTTLDIANLIASHFLHSIFRDSTTERRNV